MLDKITFWLEKEDKENLRKVCKKLGFNMAAYCRVKILEAIRTENFILNQSNSKEV